MGEILFQALIAVPSHYTKKNSKQISRNRKTGKRFIRSSNKAQLCESQLAWKLARLKKLTPNQLAISCPINLQCVFHYKKTKSGKPTKRVADLSNLLQGPEDALQKAGIILNDKLIESFDGTRRIYDADKTMLEIIITKFEG